MPVIGVPSILALNLTPNSNPFLALRDALYAEFHSLSPSKQLRISSYFFLGVSCFACVPPRSPPPMALTEPHFRLLGSIVALGTRLLRGDRAFYKLLDRPDGILIVPNAILNYVRLSHRRFGTRQDS
jgi:hypothetical protein